jgi:hypothetical protein
VLSAGPSGALAASGNWLVAAFRTGASSLLGFTRAESAEFNCSAAPPGVAWRTGAIVTSDDDGASWSRRGAAILDDMPCSPHAGGSAFASVLPNGSGYLAWGGCTAYRTDDARGAPGTWQRWRDGAFSSPGVNGSSTCLDGVPSNVCCPTVTFNSDLGVFLMVSTTWGSSDTLFIAVSDDGLAWAPPQVLLRVPAPRAVAYGQLIGAANSSVSGRVTTLAYAAAPPTGDKPRDFVYRDLTFE